jgi:hypothetical protein
LVFHQPGSQTLPPAVALRLMMLFCRSQRQGSSHSALDLSTVFHTGMKAAFGGQTFDVGG